MTEEGGGLVLREEDADLGSVELSTTGAMAIVCSSSLSLFGDFWDTVPGGMEGDRKLESGRLTLIPCAFISC